MAIKLKSTSDIALSGVKLLVYGQSGAGKTSIIRTAPEPVILSAEAGLLSLADADIPFVQVLSMDDLKEAYKWLMSSDEAKLFKTVCLDSISEVAEVSLDKELKSHADGRRAYGEMNISMASLIRAFRDLPGRHVYMSAKMEKSQDEMGRMLYGPSMPGKSLTQQLPYFFDEVLALRVEKDSEGNTQRALMCDGDGLWLAKDRSGRLSSWEVPDLSAIFKKIGGANGTD